jgi:deoxyribodipyrimidine photolyase-related protein
MPQPPRFAPDAITTLKCWTWSRGAFPGNFGTLEPFWFAVTRADAEAAFAHFLKPRACRVSATYQDAMLAGEPFLYHAVVAQYLNAGLLDPLALCRAVEAEWRAGRVPLNSAEGFIRQIIGWREFVRGIYWWKMPGYERSNALDATGRSPRSTGPPIRAWPA